MTLSDGLRNVIKSGDQIVDGITGNPLYSAVGGAVAGGAIVGIVAAASRSRKKSTRKTATKKRATRRRTTRRKSSYQYARTAGKRKDTSTRRIRMTKNGQPYVILRSGKARFISKRSARASRKKNGGRY